MLWRKKKKPGRTFKINLEAYPEMMAAPFLFGVWLDDPEWRAMLASAGKDVGPQTALLFLGNYMMIRLHLVAEGASDQSGLKMYTALHMYQTRDGGVMMKSDQLKNESDDSSQWGAPYRQDWWMTKDLGLMLVNHQIPDIGFERFKPASLLSLYAAGFQRDVIEQFIDDYAAAGAGFIETFNEAAANEFIDQRFDNEADGLDRPAPPVQ